MLDMARLLYGTASEPVDRKLLKMPDSEPEPPAVPGAAPPLKPLVSAPVMALVMGAKAACTTGRMICDSIRRLALAKLPVSASYSASPACS